ncbi:hypothetical protein [Bradyrhizobium sp. TM233]|uniref:hypothetical protein n=1 Tax=Bradyrhizobium sp. TM233 TaxID=2599801 RepID=UPI0030C6F531
MQEHSFGNDNEHHFPAPDASPGSAKTAEADGVERGHSEHSTLADAPEAAELAEPSIATASSSEGRGDSQHGPPKAAATELAEAGSMQEHSFGNDNEHHFPAPDASPASAKTAEADGVERGHSEHSTLADAPEAAELAEPNIATAGSEGRGDSQHVSEPGPAKAAATELTEAGLAPGGGAELVFRFDNNATPPTFGAVAEVPPSPHVSPGQEEDLHIIGKLIPNALDEHAVAPVHNVPHHAAVPAPHDLLI